MKYYRLSGAGATIMRRRENQFEIFREGRWVEEPSLSRFALGEPGAEEISEEEALRKIEEIYDEEVLRGLEGS